MHFAQFTLTLFLVALIGANKEIGGYSSTTGLQGAQTQQGYVNLLVLKLCLFGSASGLAPDQLVARDDPSASTRRLYDDLNYQWTTINGEIKPLAYLLPTTTTHVSAAVRCSRAAGVRVVARSGGHSYMKFGFGDEQTLVVDLQRINRVTVEEQVGGRPVAHVGGGARGGKIQYELIRRGFVASTGICPQVGISGFALGGGFGYFARRFGLGSDNLLELRMVDARGAVRDVNSETDPDLYWALRGGGGGNFGIVTRLTLRVHAAPSEITFAVAHWNLTDFPAVFEAWQAWIGGGGDPPRHTGSVMLVTGKDVTLELWSMQNGGSEEEVRQILARFPPIASGSLTLNVFTMPEFFINRGQLFTSTLVTDVAQLPNITKYEPARWRRVKSFYVDRILSSDAEVAQLFALFRDYMSAGGGTGSLVLEQYGGAINDLSPSDTAFVHRTEPGAPLYDVFMRVFSKDTNADAAVEEAARRLFGATKLLLGHTESYQNYLDEEMEDHLQRYFGANLGRLIAVKGRVDPGNVFRNSMSIPVR